MMRGSHHQPAPQPASDVEEAAVALTRLAIDAGDHADASKLDADDLFFLADLPLTPNRKRFDEARIPPDAVDRLLAIYRRATGCSLPGGVRIQSNGAKS